MESEEIEGERGREGMKWRKEHDKRGLMRTMSKFRIKKSRQGKSTW